MLTPEQIKQMRQKVDLSDLWDEVAQLPDDATRRTVQAIINRMEEGLKDILTVLMKEAEERELLKHDHDLSGKRYIIRFEQEYISV